MEGRRRTTLLDPDPSTHRIRLAATAPSSEVHLLPGFDQYILGRAAVNLAPLLPPELKAQGEQAGRLDLASRRPRGAGGRGVGGKGGDLAVELAALCPGARVTAAVSRMRELARRVSA
ncbi:hypothetical protein GCM10020220_091510 [Nonomuraea rubra]